MTTPLFDPTTHYRIEVQGRVDVAWLQSILGSLQTIIGKTTQLDEFTLIHVHTDQSGVIGLVRRLHGLGITIQRLCVVSPGGRDDEGEELR